MRSIAETLPTASGRQMSYVSGLARDLIMISGPTPVGSPMVMASSGRSASAVAVGMRGSF